MAQHKVVFSVPERELGKADLEFKVKRDGFMLGTLKVSNGSIVWVPKDYKYGFKIGWKEFDEFMKQYAKHEKN